MFFTHMTIKRGIKISLVGTGIESIGMVLDVMHHINIGIQSPEGLLTPFHAIIFGGFAINFLGVLITMVSTKKS